MQPSPDDTVTSERIRRLENAIKKLGALDDEDVNVLSALVKRERDRQIIDEWLGDLARKIVSRGKWIVAVTGLFYFFKDHAVALFDLLIDAVFDSRGL